MAKWNQKVRISNMDISLQDVREYEVIKHRYDDILHAHQHRFISDESCEIRIATLMNDIEERWPAEDLKEILVAIGISKNPARYEMYDPMG